jgi:hypothetical protein
LNNIIHDKNLINALKKQQINIFNKDLNLQPVFLYNILQAELATPKETNIFIPEFIENEVIIKLDTSSVKIPYKSPEKYPDTIIKIPLGK